MRLDNIRLLVSNLEECFHFYRDILGLRVTWGEEGSSYCSFETKDGSEIAIFRRREMAKILGTSNLPENSISQDRIMLVFNVKDIKTELEALKKRGAEIITELHNRPEWGIRLAHLRDPEGNLIEINSTIPSSEWTKELRELNRKYR